MLAIGMVQEVDKTVLAGGARRSVYKHMYVLCMYGWLNINLGNSVERSTA